MLSQTEFRNICSAELGKPYIWGAQGPDAYDCSGLVQVLLSHLNLDPPGDQTAEGLYRHFLRLDRSAPVDLRDSTLGDLVFFGNVSAVTHIGLAWGGQQMLEAGGGGRATTTPEIARSQGAEVRLRPITRRRDRVAILRLSALSWSEGAAVLNPKKLAGFGRFEGTLLTEWLADGRHMQLKLPYSYYTQDGTHWPVPANTIVDGASIPQPFWSVIGGPFEGRYRNASVLHDYYCVTKSRLWQATHRMFYEAMRCNGVDDIKAKVMYYAVYRFGPRWAVAGASILKLPIEIQAVPQIVPAPISSQSFDSTSTTTDVSHIVEADLSLEEIEALVDARG